MPDHDPFAGLSGRHARRDDQDLHDEGDAPAVSERPAVSPEPKPGDDVAHGGNRAKVVVVHPPGGVDAVLDLVVYRGRAAEVVQGVRHDFASGWGWPWEAPPPPPTLSQQLATLRRAGIRVPRVGETVLAVISAALDERRPFFSRRSRVLEVQRADVERGLVEIRLAYLASDEEPADPAEDAVTGHVYDAQLGPLKPGERRSGWAWAGWTCPPPLSHEEQIPKQPCTRCGAPHPHSRRIELYASARFGRWNFSNNPTGSTPVAQLCPPCADAVFSFATTPVAPPPAAESA